jgi:hypothetical protein
MIMMRIMNVQINENKLQTLTELKSFLAGAEVVDFKISPDQRYGFIGSIVKRFDYKGVSKSH